VATPKPPPKRGQDGRAIRAGLKQRGLI